MKLNTKNIVTGLIMPVALLGLLSINPAQAREPFTAAELAAQEQALLAQVDLGRDLWHGSKPSMTTNGLACGNCHPDAAASNPNTFPKFQANLGKVIPLRDMINWCIMAPQGGQALDVNSPEMVAMEAYAFYMYRGKTIEPGLATKQTTPVVVKSGPGFPKKGSGIGFDK
jgi:thiosulfate dehydrogenase